MSSLILFGFLLGIRHALEADHIATVASLASQRLSYRQMMTQGLAWGIGHSITILALAGGVLWLGASISSAVATTLETLVGILMVILGIDVIRRANQTRYHIHAYKMDNGETGIQLHHHSKEEMANHDSPQAHAHLHSSPSQAFPFRALSLGLIHGLAGSAAILILVMEQMESVLDGFLYLGLFSVGSLVGMFAFSVLISVPIMLSKNRLAMAQAYLQMVIGAITLGIGSNIVVAGISSL